MQEPNKYGVLINSSAKLHRNYFKEAVKLLGIRVLYRAPLPDKHYTTYAEIDSNYAPPILTGCFFHEYPNQQTLRKLGWMSELDEGASLIEVAYDLPHLQQGALFIIPSGLDNGKARIFRVTKMSTSMIYPASVTCQIVPEYQDVLNEENIYNFDENGFNIVPEDETKIPYEKLGYTQITINEEEDDWT